MISEKKLSCIAAWFRGEKISCKGIPVEKKNPTLKKKTFMACNAGKKIPRRCMSSKKKVYQTKRLYKLNHPYPLPPPPLPPHHPRLQSQFYNNWANPRALIGRELCSMCSGNCHVVFWRSAVFKIIQDGGYGKDTFKS